MESPCILVCSIDMASGYCHGCGRTRDEIAKWSYYSNAERETIMQTLSKRLTTIEKKPRRETKRKKMRRERANRQG